MRPGPAVACGILAISPFGCGPRDPEPPPPPPTQSPVARPFLERWPFLAAAQPPAPGEPPAVPAGQPEDPPRPLPPPAVPSAALHPLDELEEALRDAEGAEARVLEAWVRSVTDPAGAREALAGLDPSTLRGLTRIRYEALRGYLGQHLGDNADAYAAVEQSEALLRPWAPLAVTDLCLVSGQTPAFGRPRRAAADPVRPGTALSLYARVHRPVCRSLEEGGGFRISLQWDLSLQDAEGKEVEGFARTEEAFGRQISTRMECYQSDVYLDLHGVPLPAGLPAGTYALVLEVSDREVTEYRRASRATLPLEVR